MTASLAPATEMAMTRLRATLANMAVTDERPPLSGQRVEELEFQDGTIRSRTGNVGELLTDVLARGPAEGLEAEGESAATHHQSLAATSMGYGAVFVEVGVDAELGEIRRAPLRLGGSDNLLPQPGDRLQIALVLASEAQNEVRAAGAQIFVEILGDA